MTAPFLSPGFRATDSDDNPLAGGYISFYSAGTTTPKAVYSDADLSTSLGTSVDLNSAGAPVSGSNVPVLIYPGLGDYKIRYYDADDTLIFEFDDYPGAVAEAAEVTTGLPEIPVDSKTTAYTVVTGDRGNLINANPTGGSFAITLPSAVTVGDDFLVGFRHNGTANAVTIVATGSQVIRFQGNRAAFSLVGQGETLWLVSDGSDWIACGYVPPFRKATDPYFIVADRLTAPPANPDAGARYLINGTPTGAWSTLGFADEDIAEADGNGSWIKHTPAEGWLAFDVDEKVSLVFKNGAWENFQVDPGESTLKTLIVQDQKSSNTDGGTPTTDAWTTAVLNTSVINTITDASLASNEITLPAGRYRVKARKVFASTGESRIRFKTVDDSSVLILSESIHAGNVISTQSANAIVGVTAMLDGEFEIAVSTDFVLQYYVNVNQHTTATQGLGIPSNISGTVETYATVVIEDLASQQGPKGDEGDPGEGGLDAAYAYQFNTATSGDPGTGKILVNNATPASVTAIAVHQTDANGGVLTAVIASWDDSTSATSKARLRFQKEGSPQNFFEFLITGTGTDVGDYWTFPVSYVSHGGTISNNNDVAVLVIQTGDIGDPGTTVPDISGLTQLALTDFNRAADHFIVYDASAGSHKRMFIPVSGIDITHPSIGAVGDGSTNNNTAFATAAALGGAIIIPDGNFLITTPVMTDVNGTTWDFKGGRVVQNGTAVPGFIVDADDVTFNNPHIDCTSTKPTSNAASPYNAGIPYHAAIHQIEGDRLSIFNLNCTNWSSAVAFHGSYATSGLMEDLRIIGVTASGFDFGIIGRQFNRCTIKNLHMKDTEKTYAVDTPPHAIYITDRGTTQSKQLLIENVHDTNNAYSSSVKVRNVSGVTINNVTTKECPRSIEVDFCEHASINGYSLSDFVTYAPDTLASAILISDSSHTYVGPGVIDTGDIDMYAIRVRDDLTPAGMNRYNTIDRPEIYFEWDGSSTHPAIFIDDQFDCFINQPKLINKGTATPRRPIRINETSTRTRVIDPETVSSAGATNPERCVEVRSGAVDTVVIIDPNRLASHTSGSVSDSGTTSTVVVRQNSAQGTFTPVFTYATMGDAVITSNTATGFWYRVGKMLFVSFYLDFSTNAWTTASGNSQVTAFPVAPTASQSSWLLNLAVGGGDLAVATRHVSGRIASAATLMTIVETRDATTLATMSAAAFPASGSNYIIQGSGWYEVA